MSAGARGRLLPVVEQPACRGARLALMPRRAVGMRCTQVAAGSGTAAEQAHRKLTVATVEQVHRTPAAAAAEQVQGWSAHTVAGGTLAVAAADMPPAVAGRAARPRAAGRCCSGQAQQEQPEASGSQGQPARRNVRA